jgi:hypothetical protein
MMRTLLVSVLVLGAPTTVALAAEPDTARGQPAEPAEAQAALIAPADARRGAVSAGRTGPVGLTDGEMDGITAGIVYPVFPDELLPFLARFGVDQVYLPHPCPPGRFCIQ